MNLDAVTALHPYPINDQQVRLQAQKTAQLRAKRIP
jgi:hypothetical protein